MTSSRSMRRLPAGCRSTGGRMAIAMERCRHRFISLFNRHGYRLFWSSGLQLLETSWDLLPRTIRESLLVLTSPMGEPCCLRSDITLAAVNYLANHYSPQERPLRMCYADRLYRNPAPGGDLEKFQIGAELLGWEGEGADVEILSLLLEGLDSLGLIDGKLVLSDVTLVDNAMEKLDEELKSDLLKALQEGSYRTYFKLLSGCRSKENRLLEALPELKGGPEVLDEARKLTGAESLRSLDNISEILGRMGKSDRIAFDLGSIRELDYYSGPVFDVYSPESGKSLGGGGRYDGLLGSYGLSGQAIGFGLDLEELARHSIYRNPEPIVAIKGGGSQPDMVLSRCSAFHDAGLTTEITWSHDGNSGMARAKAKGYSWWYDPENDTVTDISREGGNTASLEVWFRNREEKGSC